MKQIKTFNCRALRWGVAALLLLVTSVAANAYDFSAQNDDGVTIYYNILSDSEASVTYGGTSYYSELYSGAVVIPETVTYDGTTYTVTSIGDSAFAYCTGLTSVISLNPEPPTCSRQVFSSVDKSTCVLYVPEGSLEAYSTADQWQDFLTIIDNQPNAIDDIMANGNAEAVGYYTTDGKKVPTLQQGVTIVRYSDGSAKKVLMK